MMSLMLPRYDTRRAAAAAAADFAAFAAAERQYFAAAAAMMLPIFMLPLLPIRYALPICCRAPCRRCRYADALILPARFADTRRPRYAAAGRCACYVDGLDTLPLLRCC